MSDVNDDYDSDVAAGPVVPFEEASRQMSITEKKFAHMLDNTKAKRTEAARKLKGTTYEGMTPSVTKCVNRWASRFMFWRKEFKKDT